LDGRWRPRGGEGDPLAQGLVEKLHLVLLARDSVLSMARAMVAPLMTGGSVVMSVPW
jgi:hypothetical protein